MAPAKTPHPLHTEIVAYSGVTAPTGTVPTSLGTEHVVRWALCSGRGGGPSTVADAQVGRSLDPKIPSDDEKLVWGSLDAITPTSFFPRPRKIYLSFEAPERLAAPVVQQ